MAFGLRKENESAVVTSSGATVVDSSNLLLSENVEMDIKAARGLYEKMREAAEEEGKKAPVAVVI